MTSQSKTSQRLRDSIRKTRADTGVQDTEVPAEAPAQALPPAARRRSKAKPPSETVAPKFGSERVWPD